MSLYLYEINDKYIEYLRSFTSLAHFIMDAKNSLSFGHFTPRTRKYLGVLITREIIIGEGDNTLPIHYFVPLSSEKKNDYALKNGNYVLDKNRDFIPLSDKLTIIRLVNSKNRVLGKLLLNNMIPVPQTEVSKYNPKKDTDRKYAEKVMNEIRIIHTKEAKILYNANVLYKLKTAKKDLSLKYPFLKDTIPFWEVEQKYLEFLRLQTNGKE